MSKTVNKWLFTAVFLVAIGVIIFATVMTVYHWDFNRLSTEQYETNTYEIEEEFTKINLNTDTSDIQFFVSDNNMCKVVCYEKAKTEHFVNVDNDTLTVNANDNRKWYEHISIAFNSPKLTIYLPKTELASIVIKASAGNVEVSDEIKADLTDISLTTGNIKLNNLDVGSLKISTTTGDIFLSNITCRGDVNTSVTTGDTKMMNFTCENLVSIGSTGDIFLNNVVASDKFSIERSTGNVMLDKSDALDIFIKTITGDVNGSLLTEKIFDAKTSTGSINVPKTTAGGKCQIITSTGNIYIK